MNAQWPVSTRQHLVGTTYALYEAWFHLPARPGSWLVRALLSASVWPASAQGRRPFEDLGRYLQACDTVFVVERTEGASPGIVSSVTPAEIVVSVSGRERGLTKETVAWIERSPDPIGTAPLSEP